MLSTELLEQFRLDVVDVELPYLWSDTEVYSYIDSAQKQFCRETGGLGDASSSVTTLNVSIGTEWIARSPLILKIREAYLPDGSPLEIINYEDLKARGVRFDGRVGPIKLLIIGMEENSVRVWPVSSEATTIQLMVDRLPLKNITDAGQKLEVADHHKDGLGTWMRHRAYSKQDAETMDRNKAESLRQEFSRYTAWAKGEADRARHKTRVVAYGGI
jgi:hypothetical protein